MDGFFLFVDPTQVSRHGPTPGLDAQINRLSSFHAEMRDIDREQAIAETATE